MYLWENPNWPALTWDAKSLTELLAEVAREQGRLLGKMEELGMVEELTGRQRDRVYAYKHYIEILSEGDELP